MIDYLPLDIVYIIIDNLDVFSKFCLIHSYSFIYYNIDSRLYYNIRDYLKSEYDKQILLQKRINYFIKKNIVIEGYNYYGECENCRKVGWLKEIYKDNYNAMLEQETKGVCIEKCNYTSKSVSDIYEINSLFS